MKVSISGQHIKIGNALQEYIQERLPHMVHKYFDSAPGASVFFSKQGIQFVCHIVLGTIGGRSIAIKSDYSSDEIYSAFDIALSKIEKQLRKYKSKLNAQHNRDKITGIKVTKATKYTITPYKQDDTIETDDETAEDSGYDNPVIIADKPIEIMTLSVSDAVMKMDLENLPALMFENIKTGRINIVYYRKDGNISWVDSK